MFTYCRQPFLAVFTYCRQPAIFPNFHLLQIILVNYIQLPPVNKWSRQCSHTADRQLSRTVFAVCSWTSVDDSIVYYRHANDLYLAIMGWTEMCFGVTNRTKTGYSCVTLLWSDRLCLLDTYMTGNQHEYKMKNFFKSVISNALPFSAEVTPSQHCAYLMLMILCLTYIRNSAVLRSSFPREYCNWALHVMYHNMSSFRVTKEVKFRCSCYVSYPWKMKAMADYHCVLQTPCIDGKTKGFVATVTKLRLGNTKLPGQMSS